MISRALEAEILRLYHSEHWLIGTIATQLRVHHSSVRRVLAQAGVPVAQTTLRPSLAAPYVAFIIETMSAPKMPPSLTLEAVRQRLRQLGLYGLLAQAEALMHEPWFTKVLDIEDAERTRRSLQRRLDEARLGTFKPVADFDWAWPTKCDRPLVDELFSLAFIAEAANVVLIGSNGLGKTMLLKNLAYQAVMHGHTARFTLASDMLHDLAAQNTTTALATRLRRYTTPTVLAIDEVGYLSYDARYADLFFEVVTRRYLNRPILLTTNLLCGAPHNTFNAASIVMRTPILGSPTFPPILRVLLSA